MLFEVAPKAKATEIMNDIAATICGQSNVPSAKKPKGSLLSGFSMLKKKK